MRSSIYGLAASAALMATNAMPTRGGRIISTREGPGVRNPRKGQFHNGRGAPVILANLSRFHPDYGMTPQAHEANKRDREAGKVKFVDKDALRVRRSALLGSL